MTPDTTFPGVVLAWTDPDSVLTNPALPKLLCYLHDAPTLEIIVVKAPPTIRIESR